ncbi:putative TetR family transcriptional regulator [Gordonia effusa NBRC 100432]|uniref:Putative TetR family transcriptional regulator n=1 Tax=Gordonia effusa NBRC 100432 TaxID=1077974 RepID=H0QWH5_9ACTN|nr:TetR/AcrR family transcriptional regulator [Gordonia effusa]GAB17176.1 putative TetR family transcriptional regulator [Gordonia effusa NBRC 100432]
MAVEEPRTRWAGLSLAERTGERRRLILDAAFALLDAGGDIGDVTIRTVCRDAGVHRRYFHESFSSRDELLGAMFDEAAVALVSEVLDAIRAARPDSTQATLRVFIRSGLTHLRQRGAHAALMVGRDSEPALQGKRVDALTAFRTLVSAPEDDIDSEVKSRNGVLATMIEGAVVEFGRRWAEGELGVDVDTAADAAADAVLALMGLNGSVIGADERAGALWRATIDSAAGDD